MTSPTTTPRPADAGTPPGANTAGATLCGRPVAAGRALVMAIVNRTPDSFYDRGASFADGPAQARVD